MHNFSSRFHKRIIAFNHYERDWVKLDEMKLSSPQWQFHQVSYSWKQCKPSFIQMKSFKSPAIASAIDRYSCLCMVPLFELTCNLAAIARYSLIQPAISCFQSPAAKPLSPLFKILDETHFSSLFINFLLCHYFCLCHFI